MTLSSFIKKAVEFIVVNVMPDPACNSSKHVARTMIDYPLESIVIM